MCCGCNKQIDTDYRSPVEKKGQHGLSLREREGVRAPNHCLDRLLLLFWVHYIEDGPHLLCTGLLLGDYLLQITKERMLLITSKRRMLQIKGKSG